MKIHQVLSPEQVVITYRIAELPARLLASLIDLIWQLIGVVAIALINTILISYFEDFYATYVEWMLAISILATAAVLFGYGVYFEFKGSGQTPGKAKVGIRTIRLNGEPVSLSHIAIRNLFKYFIDAIGIGLWYMLFDSKARRWGDMVSSTVVVYNEVD